MKVLLLKGSPRKNGVTEMLCGFLAKGIKSAEAELDEVRLSDFDISPCKGCFACSASPKGKCVISDGMDGLKQKLSRADIVICASPVYFYTMSGLMKIFWDRCFPFIRGYEKSPDGHWINKTGFEVKNKTFVSLNIGSGRFEHTYGPIVQTWNAIAQAMGFNVAANIVRAESVYFKHPNQKLEAVRSVKEALFKAGSELGSGKAIAKETLDAISQDFSENDDVFVYNSNIFWERMMSGKKFAASSDPESMLKGLCASFKAENAPDKAVIAFEFSDCGIFKTIEIENGSCKLSDGNASGFDLKIKTTANAFSDFIKGRARIMEQLSRSKIVLEGNPHLFTRLKRFFSF